MDFVIVLVGLLFGGLTAGLLRLSERLSRRP
jgi:hypothetical protein